MAAKNTHHLGHFWQFGQVLVHLAHLNGWVAKSEGKILKAWESLGIIKKLRIYNFVEQSMNPGLVAKKPRVPQPANSKEGPATSLR